MTTPIQITLMRHARSRADDENVHEGRYDSPLTDVGREQVRARAAFFAARGYKPDAIIASSLARADETARIIGAALGVSVETDPDWMEFNNGPLAGLSREEANARYPKPAFRNPYEPFFITGESEIDFHVRVAGAFQRIIRRGAGNFLVVAHGGSLNVALRVAMGIPMPVNRSGSWFHFADTSFARLDYYPQSHTCVLRELCP